MCLQVSSRARHPIRLSASCHNIHRSIKPVDYPAINRSLTAVEYDEIMEAALDLGLENAFVQELESREHFPARFQSGTSLQHHLIQF